MAFYCDETSGRPAAPPIDIRKRGIILIDFLACCRRDVEGVRWAALSGWSVRESWYGPVCIADAALALLVSLPGNLEIVIPDKNQYGLLDLRCWVTLPPPAERDEEPADVRQFAQLVIRGAGQFSPSGKWVNVRQFPGGGAVQERDGDIWRWYRDLIGQGRAVPKLIEM
jgi:hypothetical protein